MLTSNDLWNALKDAGVDLGDDVHRIVIDAQAGDIVKVYIERLDVGPIVDATAPELIALDSSQIIEDVHLGEVILAGATRNWP